MSARGRGNFIKAADITATCFFFSVHHELCLIFVQVYEIFANFLRVVSHYQYTTTVVFTLPYDSWDH